MLHSKSLEVAQEGVTQKCFQCSKTNRERLLSQVEVSRLGSKPPASETFILCDECLLS